MPALVPTLLAALLAAAPDAGAVGPAAREDVLAAAVLAPSGQLYTLDAALAGDEAFAAGPADGLSALVPGALPPPPTTVVRETRYYGTVTIDHRAHLARRAACKSCHGPGPVSKLTFTPKVAHERCVGCHQAMARGPDRCQGCHVRPPPPRQLAAADEAKRDAPAEPPGPNPANVAAALAAAPGAGAAGASYFADDPFQRYLEVGFAAGRGPGFSIRLASHEANLVLTQSVDYQASGSATRTFTMLGAGLSRLGRGRISFEGVALAGADVVSRPGVGVLPAVGLRAGAEWRPDHGFVQRVCLSVTGVADLSRHVSGRAVDASTIYGTIATGFRLP